MAAACSPNASALVKTSFDVLTPGRLAFHAFIFYFGLVYVVVCVSIFYGLKSRRTSARFRVRRLSVVTICGLGIVCYLFLSPFSYTLGEPNYPCSLGLFLTLITMPLIVGPIGARSFMLRFMLRYSRMFHNRAKALRDPWRVKFERFLLTESGQCFIVVLFCVPFLIAFGVFFSADAAYANNCHGCTVPLDVFVFVLAMGALVMITSIVNAYFLRELTDLYGLAFESKGMLFGAVVAILGVTLYAADTPGPNSDAVWDHQVLVALGLFIVLGFQTLVQAYFTFLEVESWTRGNPDSFAGIMAHPDRAKRFEHHLITELGAESLYFIIDTNEWKESFQDEAPATRLSRARKIMNSYIFTDGNLAVNIPSAMAERIREQLSAPNAIEQVTPAVFDEARNEVRILLDTGAVRRFLSKERGGS